MKTSSGLERLAGGCAHGRRRPWRSLGRQTLQDFWSLLPGPPAAPPSTLPGTFSSGHGRRCSPSIPCQGSTFGMESQVPQPVWVSPAQHEDRV